MRKHRITANDATALSEGRAVGGRPELDALATSLREFRAAAFETTPRPSAELASRLDLANATGISVLRDAADSAATIESGSLLGRATPARRGWVPKALSWFTGLGLAIKILLGSATVAVAATGMGAVGALPPGLQDAFDGVVSAVLPSDDSTVDDDGDGSGEPGTDGVDDTDGDATAEDPEAPTGYDPSEGNFGSWVSDEAQNKPGTGREFGQHVSDEAKNKPHGAPSGHGDGNVGGEGDGAGTDAPDDEDAVVDGHGNGEHGKAENKGGHR